MIYSDFSDSGSDSSDGGLDDLSGDERAEALLNNPSARRRQSHKRKRNAKDDATYGVFGDDMNLEEQQQQPGSNKRYHKMPTFVSSSNSKAQDPAAEEQTEIDNLAEAGLGAQAGGSSSKEGALDQNDDDEDEDSDDMETSSDSSGEEDQQSKAAASTDVRPDDPEQPRAGLGAGLGMPTSFGRPQNASTSQSSQPKQSFLPQKPSSFLPKPRANLTNEEKRHFAKLEGAGGIGFKMLSKMGWSTGTGLGAGGEGRVNPVDSQQRPVNMGIGYQGFKEKTKQSVQEARRRGDHVSEDEDEEAKPSKGKGRRRAGDDQQQQGPKEKAWKAPKPKKRQVQHLSYEEILAQQSADQLGGAQVESGVGQIIDMTGAEVSYNQPQRYVRVATELSLRCRCSTAAIASDFPAVQSASAQQRDGAIAGAAVQRQAHQRQSQSRAGLACQRGKHRAAKATEHLGRTEESSGHDEPRGEAYVGWLLFTPCGHVSYSLVSLQALLRSSTSCR